MDLQPLKIDRGQPKPITPSATAPVRGGGPPRSWTGPILLVGVLFLAILLRAPLLRVLDKWTLLRVRAVRVEESDPRAVGTIQGTAANGYVVAARRAALSADTPGRIVEMRVEEGTTVKKGQVVARLFSEEYEAALLRGEAEVLAAKAGEVRAVADRDAAAADVVRLEQSAKSAAAMVAMGQADLSLAEAEIKRVEELIRKQIATGRDLDNARAALQRSKAGLDNARAREERMSTAELAAGAARLKVADAALGEAKARVAVAEAGRDQVKATLSKTELRAPFDGIVVLKDAEVGEVVSPNVGGGSTRGSVVTMVDFASLEVQVDVPETNIKDVKKGERAEIYLDAFPSQPYRGRVDRIWPTASRDKATIEVRVTFAEPDDKLRPDMGARVVFVPSGQERPKAPTVHDPQRLLLIPEDALVRRDGKEGVFVLEGDTVHFRAIETAGPPANDQVVVKSGVQRGEAIVSPAPPSLDDGDRVMPEQEEAK